MGIFDDRNSLEGDQLSWKAEVAQSNGRIAEAKKLYAEAAEKEEAFLAVIPLSKSRIRGTIAISAVARWMKGGHFDRASVLACTELANPDRLTEAGREELETLLRQVWQEQIRAKSL